MGSDSLKEGSFHQAMNPFKLSKNKKCRMKYHKGMCKKSLEILYRTIMIPTDPKNTSHQTNITIKNIKKAALALVSNEKIKIKQKEIDKGKFDYKDN